MNVTRDQLKKMLQERYGGSTVNGRIIGDKELDDYISLQLRNAALHVPPSLEVPDSQRKQPVKSLIAEVPSYEKAAERERLSALARPLQTLSNLWPQDQRRSKTAPWKDVLFGTEGVTGLSAELPGVGDIGSGRTGMLSFNTAVSVGNQLLNIARPFYELGKLMTYGVVVGDLPVSPGDAGPKVSEAQATQTQQRLKDYLPTFNKMLREKGMEEVDEVTYNDLIKNEYPSLHGLTELAREIKDITYEGYPVDASPQEVKKEFPLLANMADHMKTYTDAGTYVSTYGAAGSLERLKEKLRDDPAEPLTDAFGVINPALRSAGKMGDLISKIPGVEYSKSGKALLNTLEDVGNIPKGTSTLRGVRHLPMLDPVVATGKTAEWVNNVAARKWANIWSYVSRTSPGAGEKVVFGYTPRMGEIFRGKVDPTDMLNFYYDKLSAVERSMKKQYAAMLNDKFSHVITDQTTGEAIPYNDVYKNIQKTTQEIGKKYRFKSEEVPLGGAVGDAPATSFTVTGGFQEIPREKGVSSQTTTHWDAKGPESRLYKERDDAIVAERMLEEVEQVKREIIYDGRVDASGKPIFTFKDLDDLRSSLRLQYQGMNLPSGKSWKKSIVSNVYNDLYSTITDAMENGIKAKHYRTSPDTKAPSYLKDLKDPYRTVSLFLEDIEDAFRIDPKTPFEHKLTTEKQQAWTDMYKVLKEDEYFRKLLSDELMEKTGVDLAQDLGAFTYAKVGTAAPGIAAARVVDSIGPFAYAMIGTTPGFAGKMLRAVGIPRAQIGALVDFMRIRDMEKARLGTRVAQLSREDQLNREELETDIMSQWVDGKPLTPEDRKKRGSLQQLIDQVEKKEHTYTGPTN